MTLITARLPSFLRPQPTRHLVRLGRPHDGGYLVDERDIQVSDVLLGFGIKDDWSFEDDFVSRKSVPVYAFDPTINKRMFFRNILKAVPRLDNPRIAYHALRTWVDYRRFFRGDRHHLENYVGATNWPASMSLRQIRENIVPASARKPFLKIDIEGWEYRILDDLTDLSSQITGVVIEFHDVDLHLERIEAFVARFPLLLCHVHCNNYSPLSADMIPTTIECSFTSQLADDLPLELPHPLDMPNNPQTSDCRIQFDEALFDRRI